MSSSLSCLRAHPGTGSLSCRRAFVALPHRRADRRGYVLLMVLAILVLSTSLLVGVARIATRRVAQANDGRRDLQQRWGQQSCRTAVLPQVEELLTIQEAMRNKPVPVHTARVTLGNMTFELTLADEQSKANVNAMLAVSDVTRTESGLRLGLAGSGLMNQIRLRTIAGPVAFVPATQPAEPRPVPQVAGLGQVFDGVEPWRLLQPMPGSKAAAVDLLTCWGSGAINARRASATAMTLAAGRSVSGAQVARLIEARDGLYERTSTGGAGQSALAADRLRTEIRAAITESQKAGGHLGLGERSACHSLWIVTHDGRRARYNLSVADRSNDAKPVLHSFSW